MTNILDRRKRKNLLMEENEIKKEKVIKTYGRMLNLSKKLLNDIDYTDKTYINRIYQDKEELEINDLKESIKDIGLINLVYLLKKPGNKLIIVSGLRRLTACRELYEEDVDVIGRERVVLFEEGTPEEYLEQISIDENTKRKNLKIIELSYKLNKEAEKENLTMEDIMEKYNIGRRHFFRIKGAITYPQELKDILEEIGISKAELINKIIKIDKESNTSEIIKKYRNFTKEDLQSIIQKLKKEQKKDEISYTQKGRKLNIKINKKLPKEVKQYILDILGKIENDDFSFMD